MKQFQYIHAIASDWKSVCEKTARELDSTTYPGNLGFVYLSEHLARDTARILEFLKISSGIEHWVGTVGSGLCSTGLETYDQPAMALMITDLDYDKYRIIPGIDDDYRQFVADTEAWRRETNSYFGIVHGDPRNPRLPVTLTQLGHALDGGFFVGGLTSSANEDFVQIAGGLTETGLSGVLVSGKIDVATGLTQGCSLIGEKYVVTACERNIVSTLNNRPALEVFKEEIGPELANDLAKTAGLIFVALPVAGSDTGDYLVRNVIGIDPDRGMLALGELVHEGTHLQFARRDKNTAREDLERMLSSLTARISNRPKGALYYSCLGRGRHLFGDHSEELKIIQKHLDDTPLIGFYANGEISHNNLYGYTGVLTLFL